MKNQKEEKIRFSKFGYQNPSFFQREEEIIARLNQISHSTKSSQEIGRALEEYYSALLKGLLPIGYRVETRCRVIDKNGNSSREIDLAIVDSRFPTLFRTTDGSSLLMHESVAKVFELKRSLDSKEISDIFAKVFDWVKFKISALQKKVGKKIDCFRHDYASQFITLCVESRISSKTIRKKLEEESRNYNGATNPMTVFILRTRESQKVRGGIIPPIGLFCWWEGLKSLEFNQTFASLSDCIYALHQDLSEEDIRRKVQQYFHWGTVWTRDRIEKLIKSFKGQSSIYRNIPG
jgi:hypothetical protein